MKREVNHINGIKDDNRATNLEWNTSSENTRHAMKIGKQKMLGEDNSSAKLTKENVIYIRDCNLTNKELSIKFKVTPTTIWDIRNRKTWKNI